MAYIVLNFLSFLEFCQFSRISLKKTKKIQENILYKIGFAVNSKSVSILEPFMVLLISQSPCMCVLYKCICSKVVRAFLIAQGDYRT